MPLWLGYELTTGINLPCIPVAISDKREVRQPGVFQTLVCWSLGHKNGMESNLSMDQDLWYHPTHIFYLVLVTQTSWLKAKFIFNQHGCGCTYICMLHTLKVCSSGNSQTLAGACISVWFTCKSEFHMRGEEFLSVNCQMTMKSISSREDRDR